MVENLTKAISLIDDLIKKAASIHPDDLQVATASPLANRKAGKGRDHTKAAKAVKAAPPVNEGLDAEKFKKAKLGVGLVTQVDEMSNSDKLYRCQVQVAPDETRQIVAGLRKHVRRKDLMGKLVVTVLNLSAKIAGETSDGMILAAVTKGDQYEHGELVRPLSAPANASPGELVFLEGGAPSEAYPKDCRQWKKLLPFLAVKSSTATFDGKSLHCSSGVITADTCMPDGASIS